MRFQKAEDVIAIIEQRKNRGYGLDHFKQYMASLGNPQNRLRSIHVAGTNGKGSTTNDIRSILQAAGYKVGSFTSPFMITHLDRIRINDQDIREDAFLEITNRFYDSWMNTCSYNMINNLEINILIYFVGTVIITFLVSALILRKQEIR